MKSTYGIVHFAFAALFVLLAATSASSEEASWQQELFGATLVRSDGQEVETAGQLKGKIVGVYFSAHWCGPCRAFTPKLVQLRNRLSEEGKPFEVVFVSCDRSQSEMKRYISQAGMKWLSVPYAGSARNRLMEHFRVEGIPTLVVLDAQGKVLTSDGREDVMRRGADAFGYWEKGKSASPAAQRWNTTVGPLRSRAEAMMRNNGRLK